jgi:hypothetical protein
MAITFNYVHIDQGIYTVEIGRLSPSFQTGLVYFVGQKAKSSRRRVKPTQDTSATRSTRSATRAEPVEPAKPATNKCNACLGDISKGTFAISRVKHGERTR